MPRIVFWPRLRRLHLEQSPRDGERRPRHPLRGNPAPAQRGTELARGTRVRPGCVGCHRATGRVQSTSHPCTCPEGNDDCFGALIYTTRGRRLAAGRQAGPGGAFISGHLRATTGSQRRAASAAGFRTAHRSRTDRQHVHHAGREPYGDVGRHGAGTAVTAQGGQRTCSPRGEDTEPLTTPSCVPQLLLAARGDKRSSRSFWDPSERQRKATLSEQPGQQQRRLQTGGTGRLHRDTSIS